MMNDKANLNEKFLDDAAAEAIGAHGVEESDAFTVALGQADDAHRQASRELRDTVARMAGAAPYIDPPTRLRGAILEATAPKSFKIDDYRRAADLSPKWLRRSLVASIGFLIFAAWYNAAAKTTIDNQQKQIADMTSQMNGKLVQVKAEFDSMARANAQSNLALSALSNDKASRWKLESNTGESMVLIQVPETKQLLLVMPDRVVPSDAVATFTIEQNGKAQEIRALAIGKPGDGLLGGPPVTTNFDHGQPLNVHVTGVSNVQNASLGGMFAPK